MRRRSWKTRIKKACKAAGTYQPFFDTTIDALAGVMEMRDKAQEKFEESGGETVVTYTNKNGNENMVKNPALVVLMECNAQALSFWRELGLTPAGLKKINEEGLKVKEQADTKSVLEVIRTKRAQ